ncbi:hypothetical protein [Microcoleus vaginatus]|uniref:hypothetical protein n=1 Tax=Microcoleus vaginatus TaxID=119532 RepID=UPI00403F5F7F
MNSSLDRNPVILIHGIWDTKIIFSKMSARLTELGWSVPQPQPHPQRRQPRP